MLVFSTNAIFWAFFICGEIMSKFVHVTALITKSYLVEIQDDQTIEDAKNVVIDNDSYAHNDFQITDAFEADWSENTDETYYL